MRPQERATARRQLDKRLNSLRNSEEFTRPSHGWIKAVREALGMTTRQLAKRLGVTQPRAVAIEQAEARGSITLDTLERAARALDCRLVYVLVPRAPLDTLAQERAMARAREQLRSTRHSMALEAQSVEASDEQAQLEALARRLLDASGSGLWADE
jgi:predicted DNA-binding mobile mystery protein A